MRFTFKRHERLKSRKTIGRLFKKGRSHGAYPLRLVWLELPENEGAAGAPVQFGGSVPKRNFKSAVARNRLKRRGKEAWRVNKPWLYEQLAGPGKQFAFMVLYTGKEEFEQAKIESSLRKLNRAFLAKTFPERAKKREEAANRNPKQNHLPK